ncbi:MAG TPA: hypothetical protein VFY61_18220 [Pyrinomonadaceae bacterium]|nr:hypothetical protein [Pyrinomonadaceae bacterium]
MRPFPSVLAKLGVAPVPTDFTPADSSAFATAITNSVGGDTITLTAGQTYTGPFTLKSGLSSTVTIRSSGHASLPADGQRVQSSDRSNMAIIVCSNSANQACFSTTGNDADNWRLTGLDMRQANGVGNAGAMVKTGNDADTTAANTPNNIEIDHCWIEATQSGTVRGIFINGRNINVHDNYISGFRNAGQECQAILLAGGPGPVTIDNNYMMSLGEVFMSGGLTVGILPGDLTFTRNYLEAPQKYNPWNPSVFDTSDVQGSTNLGCSLTSSGTTVTCSGHGQGVSPNTTIRVLKLTSGPQSGEMRTVSSAPTSSTLTIETPFSANQSGVSATLYTPFTGHKNNFELKFLEGTTNLIEGNVFDGTWVMGQDGTGLVITVRTENNQLTTATIKNTTFQYNWFRRFNGFLKYLSPDDFNGGSGLPMEDVVLKHNLIEPTYQFSGPGTQSGSPSNSPRVALYNGASSPTLGTDIWFQHNTVYSAKNVSTVNAFVGNTGGDWINFKLENNLFAIDSSFGGIFGEGTTGTGTTALNNWCNGAGNYSAVNNTFQNQNVSSYPTGSFSETSAANFGFNSVANLDFKLTSGLYRAGQSREASDGTDRGADIDTLSTKIGASSNAYASATISTITGIWSTGTLLAKAGSFTASNSTGNQAITGVGFQPKVVLFRYNMQGTDASMGDSTIGFGVGVSSSDRRVAGDYSNSGLSTSSHAAWNQSSYVIYTPGGGYRADFVSMDSDGFTINWATASQMVVTYLALGGDAITHVKTGSAAAKTTTGNESYTGLGFQPTALIVWAGKFSTTPLDQSTNGNALFGVATSSSARGMVAWRNLNNSNPQVAKRRQSTQRVLSTTTTFTEADFVSFDSDGFTLNYTTSGGNADIFYYLALRGPQVKVSAFNQATTTGNQSITGAGFTPKAAIMMSANDVSGNNDSALAHARASFGWATGTSERASFWIGETDNVSPTVASRNLDRTKLIKLMTEGTPTVNAAADHVSFDSDGQTINWTTADGTARQIIVFGIG